MIGKIITGKSFRGCIQYCLHDKTADEKEREQLMKDRAEVIAYNQCFGNARELIQQFNEVRSLNPKLSKPVLHITLSLAKGEHVPAFKLAEIAESCAQDLGFSKNQYIGVMHKDTEHQHVHIVANRIGYDGKTISDSNNYQRIARFCRQMEVKHGLEQVASPNAFLPKELRNYQRLDERKEKLKNDIKRSLDASKNYEDFVQRMTARKYEVIKMRGIAFRDQQKVYTKGSEVGYSLATIEKILEKKQQLQQVKQTSIKHVHPHHEQTPKQQIPVENEKEIQPDRSQLLDALLPITPDFQEGLNYALTNKKKKRKKKGAHRHL